MENNDWTITYSDYEMKVKAVQSATVAYLIFGLLSLAVLIFGIIEVPPVIISKKEYAVIPILIIPALILVCMSVVFISSYRKRKEFCIYSIEKKGSIDFDKLREEFIQVKDEPGVMYLVKKSDYESYRTYAIMNESN